MAIRVKNLKDKIYGSHFLKLAAKYLFSNLSDAGHKVIVENRAFIFLRLMLVRLGNQDGWSQLRKLKEMETVVRSPGFDQ